jgi:hypothetical protein
MDSATAKLTIVGVQTVNAGKYTVAVSNAVGSATSATATLTVDNPPAITVQPANQTVAVGKAVRLTITATGTASLKYQWLENGTNLANGGNISGVTTAALAISDAQSNNSGTYSVLITNLVGSVLSSNAVVMVENAPSIISQPVSATIAVGSNVNFIVVASGTAPLIYQWKLNNANLADGGNISGSSTSTLAISAAQTNNAGKYTVAVSNAVGSANSGTATLTVDYPPSITVQPTNQTVTPGKTVKLTVTATGTAPLKYQWLENATNLANGGNISGVTTATLTITKAQTTNTGVYGVLVTNVVGSVTSSNAVLLVDSLLAGDLIEPVALPAIEEVELLPGNLLEIIVLAGDATSVQIQSTADLSTDQWTTISTNTVNEGRAVFVGTVPATEAVRFYRAVVPQSSLEK